MAPPDSQRGGFVRLDGLHLVTAVSADVATNLDFFGRLLGLRLVWHV